MPVANKPKPCNCGSKNLTPKEIMQDMIETRSSVCFQSLNELQRISLQGVFPGAARGVNSRRNAILDTGWIIPD